MFEFNTSMVMNCAYHSRIARYCSSCQSINGSEAFADKPTAQSLHTTLLSNVQVRPKCWPGLCLHHQHPWILLDSQAPSGPVQQYNCITACQLLMAGAVNMSVSSFCWQACVTCWHCC